MIKTANRYAWSALLNHSSEKLLVALCKNYTPRNYCYVFVLDMVRDFCECVNAEIPNHIVTLEAIAKGAQRVLSCLGIITEVYFEEGGHKLRLKAERQT